MNKNASDTIWELITIGRYAEAIAIGEPLLAQDSALALSVAGNLAHAYLASGRFQGAYECYMRAHDLQQRHAPPGGSYLDFAARAAWLANDRPAALRLAVEDVRALASEQTIMADAAGGVSNALFLHYCASLLSDERAKCEAMEFIRLLSKRQRRFENWPGPLGAFYLGSLAYEDVLFAASEQREIGSALMVASHSKLVRRELIEALFYVGAKWREQSDYKGCTTLMEAASSLPNPFAELEWYLARKELLT